jgi:uncharacterized protein YegL
MDDDENEYIPRLPVYLLLDCSTSMDGEPIQAMEDGLKNFLADLIGEPAARESVWLSVITFGNVARQVVPLTEINTFQVPPLKAEGGTALGEAFELLSAKIDAEVRKTTENQKGDWKPQVIVFTDGNPADEWEEPVENFRRSNIASVIACGAGPEVNDEVLKQIGDKVIRLIDTQAGTIAGLIDWLSQAMKSCSTTLGTRVTGSELSDLPPDVGIILLA